MPDPKLALPVKTELRLGKHVVVDADGKRVPGTDVSEDEDKARAVAASINDAWKQAKADRKSKGAPELTQESRFDRKLEEFGWPARATHSKFDPRLHPHDRLGRFTEALERLRDSGHGSSIELPHGVKVRKGLVGFEVSHPGGKRRMASSAGAAVEAFAHVDEGDIADGAQDPDLLYRQRMGELRQARRGAAQGFAADIDRLDELVRTERLRRSQRVGSVHIRPHRGRTDASKEAYTKAHPRVDMTTLVRNSDEITAAMHRLRPA